MPIAQGPAIAAVAGTTTAASASVTTAASGNAIRVGCAYNSGTFVSVTDNKGNSYTDFVTESVDGPGGMSSRVVGCDNASGGAGHIITLTTTASGLPTMMADVTTGADSPPTDKTIAGNLVTGAGPFAGTTTGTLAQANERVITWIFTNTGGTANHVLGGTVFVSGDRDTQFTNGSSQWTGAKASKIVSATTALIPSWTEASGTNRATMMTVSLKEAPGGSPPTLSSPTSTSITASGATVGATSTSNTGTAYAVLSTTNNVSTATAVQVAAGQNSTGATAAFSNNAAVSTTSPAVTFTGLAASTTYFYAIAHTDANGNSNVVSGSFTTSAAPVFILMGQACF